jgi:putative molybdopterin biosynthesis protein
LIFEIILSIFSPHQEEIMSDEMMNTKELAGYLGIHEKQVYALLKAGRIPGTRVTGKWVFPRKTIDEWIETNARDGLKDVREKSRRIEGALLAAGSNDPILDMLQTYVKKTGPEFYIFSANTGSARGLKALNDGFTDIAWSHLLDPESGQYNIPFLPTYLPHVEAVVVHLFRREVGFITAPNNPRGVRGFEDLARDDVRFINRQAGSGIRTLLDHHLTKKGIEPRRIRGYEDEVYTHFEVGLSILSGEADTGIAAVAVSRLLGLPFIAVTRENFDMVLSRATYFEKPVQALIGSLRSREFRDRVSNLGNYDFEDAGKILHSPA